MENGTPQRDPETGNQEPSQPESSGDKPAGGTDSDVDTGGQSGEAGPSGTGESSVS